MKIQILGSAAAEAVPALWCSCETCQYARKHGGKDLRRRTAYAVDADTLVDFGPDAFWQSVEFNIDLTAVKRILFTHSHEDHLNPIDLLWRQKWYSVVEHNIKMYATPGTIKRMESFHDLESLFIEPVVLKGFDKLEDDGLSIVTVPASHIPDELCVNYVLTRNGKSILIANDTGWWQDESWEFIRNFKLDAAIIECTFALSPNNLDYRSGHLGAHAAIDFRNKLQDSGVLNPHAQVAVNHYSHNGAPLQHKLEEYYKNSGIMVGYDGMVINL